MLTVRDVAVAVVGATGDLAEPEKGTEQTEPAVKELGEDVSPSAELTERVAGEVTAAAAEAGACSVACTAQTGDSGLDGAGRQKVREPTAQRQASRAPPGEARYF
jgi:hypothetical protein